MLTGRLFRPKHLSELASAVATLELRAGHAKRSKRWFSMALEAPTENSLAQVAWASRQHKSIDLDHYYVTVPNAFEAESLTHFQRGEWRDAVDKCELWLFDQPFSNRPSIFGSFLSAITLEDYEKSRQFAERGLMSNPNDPMLLNNLAFALINQGDLGGAKKALGKASQLLSSDPYLMGVKTTMGLWQFRNGNSERGRELYNEAISKARKTQGEEGSTIVALAALFHAMEEASLGSQDLEAVLSRARRIVSSREEPIWKLLEHKLTKMSTQLRPAVC